MKIAVYTLCKNEQNNIKSWINHLHDADYIIVGDTGSTDNSVSLLREAGATVHLLSIVPWRFDVARNELLSRIPHDVDICISLDFDERLSSGWRNVIENFWRSSITRLYYNYTEVEMTNPPTVVSVISSRIHHRHGYEWKYPVHELLHYNGPNQEIAMTTNQLEITHKPDKIKDRFMYLHLMEQAIKEEPENSRLMFQLGRDYLTYKYFDKGIDIFNRHLSLIEASYEQKLASQRYIARALLEKGEYEQALNILQALIDENPKCSSNYVEYIISAYKQRDWGNIVDIASHLKAINYSYSSLYNEFKNGKFTMHDIISIAFYNVKDYKNALLYAESALAIEPHEGRIKKNIAYFKHMLNKS